jgi:predicted transcriptional regulator
MLAVSGGVLAELLTTTKQLIKILQRKKLIFKNIMFFYVFMINIQQKFYVR